MNWKRLAGLVLGALPAIGSIISPEHVPPVVGVLGGIASTTALLIKKRQGPGPAPFDTQKAEDTVKRMFPK